jgi:beta-lactamase regulating signal transducer with metallopeptidase domain
MNAPSHLGSFALIVATGLAVALAVALLCHLIWPPLERLSRAWHPRWRAAFLQLIACAPIAIPVIALLLCVEPGLVGHWTGHEDHCAHHADHPHLCLVHASVALTPSLGLILWFFVAAIGVWFVGVVRRTRYAVAEQRFLDERAERWLAPDVRVVASSELFALTGGFLRTRIWLSSALDAALTPVEREIVLGHERAHAARKDPLRGWLASTFSIAHLSETRRSILAALNLAIEQTCDLETAQGVGDRLRVAQTILRIEGLMRSRPFVSPLATTMAGVTGSTVPERVHRLLIDEAPEPARIPSAHLLIFLVATGLIVSKPLHHLAEHLIALIYRLV